MRSRPARARFWGSLDGFGAGSFGDSGTTPDSGAGSGRDTHTTRDAQGPYVAKVYFGTPTVYYFGTPQIPAPVFHREHRERGIAPSATSGQPQLRDTQTISGHPRFVRRTNSRIPCRIPGHPFFARSIQRSASWMWFWDTRFRDTQLFAWFQVAAFPHGILGDGGNFRTRGNFRGNFRTPTERDSGADSGTPRFRDTHKFREARRSSTR